MIHIDLFSGIGGFALATEMVWGDVEHIFCDNDDFCQLILKKHWPTSKIYGDISELIADTNNSRSGTPEHENHKNRKEKNEGRKKQPQHRLGGQGSVASNADNSRLKGSKLLQQGRTRNRWSSEVFILTGGFPCQPFSQAGRRKGTADDRYLWPQMFAVIRNTQPQWVIAENVGGLVTWNNGMVLEQVCTDLEGENYEVQPFIIPAVSVNAPHRRDRVWFIAHKFSKRPHYQTNKQKLERKRGNQFCSEQPRDMGETYPNSTNEGLQRSSNETERHTGQRSGERSNQTQDSDVKNTKCERGGQRVEGSRQILESQSSKAKNARPSWEKNWIEIATRLCRVDDGIPRRLDRNPRLKALGNAIVPQVAAEIMKAIAL